MNLLEQKPVRIGPVATEWYKPLELNPSFATKLQIGRVMVGFYGKEAIDVSRRLTQVKTFTRPEAEAIDSHFFTATLRIYDLPEGTNPHEFYMGQNKGAIAVIQSMGRLVPELASAFALKDEIVRLSERPSDLLELLSSLPMDCDHMALDRLFNIDPDGPKRIDRRLAFEARRHAIIHYQIGIINARNLKWKLRTVLADMQDLVDDKLYEGPKGYGRDMVCESYHDDETNEVVGFPDHNEKRPLTAHLKRMRLSVRRMRDVGTIYSNDRKKDDGAAIMKSWVKALRNGGIIHIDDSVQDSIGMTFVAMQDSVKPQELADMVMETIRLGIEERIALDHYRKLPRVVKIEQDDTANEDRGQSFAPAFNARRKMWLEDIPTPIEFMFYDRETYLNSKLEVGHRDPETGLYMGRAHDLFEQRRARDAVRLVFPQVVYRDLDDYRINYAFVNRSKQIAYSLRSMDRAA